MMNSTGLPVTIHQRRIERIVDFKHGEVPEIFPDTVNRQNLLHKRLSSDLFGPAPGPALVSVGGVNLADPSGVPVTGRTQKNFRVEIPEIEALYVLIEVIYAIGEFLQRRSTLL
jgi:hypothetical protein